MSDDPADTDAPAGDASARSPEALAARTLDLMQDQISAMAADPQTGEQMQRWLQLVLQLSGPMAAAQTMMGATSAGAMAGWAGLWQQAAGARPGGGWPGSTWTSGAAASEAGAGDGAPSGGGERTDAGTGERKGQTPGSAPAGRAPGESPGAAPAAAAPDDGGARVERLEARLAELERQLAERTGGTSGDAAAAPAAAPARPRGGARTGQRRRRS